MSSDQSVGAADLKGLRRGALGLTGKKLMDHQERLGVTWPFQTRWALPRARWIGCLRWVGVVGVDDALRCGVMQALNGYIHSEVAKALQTRSGVAQLKNTVEHPTNLQ